LSIYKQNAQIKNRVTDTLEKRGNVRLLNFCAQVFQA